jgi:hypothetical protein
MHVYIPLIRLALATIAVPPPSYSPQACLYGCITFQDLSTLQICKNDRGTVEHAPKFQAKFQGTAKRSGIWKLRRQVSDRGMYTHNPEGLTVGREWT